MKNVLPQLAVTSSSAPVASSCVAAGGHARSSLTRAIWSLPGSREPGRLEDERHAVGGRVGQAAPRQRPSRCGPRRAARAGRASSRAGPSSRWRAPAAAGPGRAISTIRSTVAGGAARLVQRRAGRERVAGVEADARPWGGGRARRGTARGPRPRRTGDRPWPAVGSSSSHGSRVALDASRGSAAAPRGPAAAPPRAARRSPLVVDVRPGVHDHALGADLHRAPYVVRDRRHRPLVRRRRGRAQVDEVRRVDDHPDPVGRAALPERRVLGRLALAQRPAARVAGEDLQRLEPELAGALERAPDQPRADLDVGADRVAQARHTTVDR